METILKGTVTHKHTQTQTQDRSLAVCDSGAVYLQSELSHDQRLVTVSLTLSHTCTETLFNKVYSNITGHETDSLPLFLFVQFTLWSKGTHPNNSHCSHTKPPFTSTITACFFHCTFKYKNWPKQKPTALWGLAHFTSTRNNCSHSEHRKDNCIIIMVCTNAIIRVKAVYLADTWCQNFYYILQKNV